MSTRAMVQNPKEPKYSRKRLRNQHNYRNDRVFILKRILFDSHSTLTRLRKKIMKDLRPCEKPSDSNTAYNFSNCC